MQSKHEDQADNRNQRGGCPGVVESSRPAWIETVLPESACIELSVRLTSVAKRSVREVTLHNVETVISRCW
jgi:hypothetical protein